METQNEQAKQVYQQLALNMDNTVTQLRSRLDFMMSEEPQYQQEIQGTFPQQSPGKSKK